MDQQDLDSKKDNIVIEKKKRVTFKKKNVFRGMDQQDFDSKRDNHRELPSWFTLTPKNFHPKIMI